MSTQSAALEEFRLADAASHVRNRLWRWRLVEAGERVFSLALLLLLSPFLLVIAAAIVVLSGRSPLIAHRRVGQGGRTIWVLKLRTMWQPGRRRRNIRLVERLSSETTPAIIKPQRDPRVTSRFARLCRKYSIDELPQLLQVMTGDLALVGPRPLTFSEIETYYRESSVDLLCLKPGLSGLWQVRGRSRLTYAQRRKLDLFMIRNWSLRLYLAIILRTIPSVFAGKNAW